MLFSSGTFYFKSGKKKQKTRDLQILKQHYFFFLLQLRQLLAIAAISHPLSHQTGTYPKDAPQPQECTKALLFSFTLELWI